MPRKKASLGSTGGTGSSQDTSTPFDDRPGGAASEADEKGLGQAQQATLGGGGGGSSLSVQGGGRAVMMRWPKNGGVVSEIPLTSVDKDEWPG